MRYINKTKTNIMRTYKTYKTLDITLTKVHSEFYCGTYKTKGGIELSVFVLTDGNGYVILPEAKDYKRIGEGDDIADACVFLGSSMSNYITGQVLGVNGGMYT